jgi:hypothetical protein
MVCISTFKYADVKCDTSLSDNGFPDVLAKSCIECSDEFNDLWLAVN